MFPKEKPGHASVERMSIVLMLKMYMHCLLLGPSLSVHVTCHYHLKIVQSYYRSPLQMGNVCMCVSIRIFTHTRHALETHSRNALYVMVKLLSPLKS